MGLAAAASAYKPSSSAVPSTTLKAASLAVPWVTRVKPGSSPGPLARSLIRYSQILPRAISERLQIRCFLTTPSSNPTPEAMLPTPRDQDMSTPALAVFSPIATCLATLPQLMHDGAPWPPRHVDFRCQRCAKWISDPILTSSKLMDTMAISKASKSIVHFYNTRDVLRRCGANDASEGTTRWPPPESTDKDDTKFVGRLGLSDEEEGWMGSDADAHRRLPATVNEFTDAQIKLNCTSIVRPLPRRGWESFLKIRPRRAQMNKLLALRRQP